MNFGKKIKSLRESKGWSQGTLAQRSDLAQSTISTLEIRTKHPNAQILQQVANALGTTVEDLLTEKEATK